MSDGFDEVPIHRVLADVLVDAFECQPAQLRRDATLEALGFDSLLAIELIVNVATEAGIHPDWAQPWPLTTTLGEIDAQLRHFLPAGGR